MALRVFEPTLDGKLPKADGWSYKFLKRTAKGAGFEYEFEASRLNGGAPEKQPLTVPAVPPATADLEQMARADLSRPDAYEYKDLKTTYDAKTGNKTFDLFAERTEWRIRHTVIKDASGPTSRPPATRSTGASPPSRPEPDPGQGAASQLRTSGGASPAGTST